MLLLRRSSDKAPYIKFRGSFLTDHNGSGYLFALPYKVLEPSSVISEYDPNYDSNFEPVKFLSLDYVIWYVMASNKYNLALIGPGPKWLIDGELLDENSGQVFSMNMIYTLLTLKDFDWENNVYWLPDMVRF